jgi:hypothetical protein
MEYRLKQDILHIDEKFSIMDEKVTALQKCADQYAPSIQTTIQKV